MTKREGCVLTAYTGLSLASSFYDFHKYAEELLGRPIFNHEFGNEDVAKEIKKASEKDFLEIMKNQTD